MLDVRLPFRSIFSSLLISREPAPEDEVGTPYNTRVWHRNVNNIASPSRESMHTADSTDCCRPACVMREFVALEQSGHFDA